MGEQAPGGRYPLAGQLISFTGSTGLAGVIGGDLELYKHFEYGVCVTAGGLLLASAAAVIDRITYPRRSTEH